jgi:cell wall-associated NlpC family hydrolase
MPVLNPPDVSGSPYAQGAAANPATVGQQAVNAGLPCVGTPYVYSATGPPGPNGGFDCSGFTQWCYQNGPGIAIGRDTLSQFSNNTTLTTLYNVVNATAPFDPSTLQPGDLIYFADQPGAGGPNAHVQMYQGNGNIIAAQGTAVVANVPFSIEGGGHPFQGVKRPSGEGAGQAGATNNATGSQGSSSKSSDPNVNGSLTTSASQVKNLPDPRDNLPFSAAFLGQRGPTGMAGRSGSVAFKLPGVSGSVMPATTLVRGGMTELIGNTTSSSPNNPVVTQRPGGNFKCYFMMNPMTISYDMNINTDITAPSQQDPALTAIGSYLLTQETISFTVIFNRMYEVWQGNVTGPKGGPGPSLMGCRWDMRALERLMGMYDATQTPGSKLSTTVGVGNNGAGANPPMSLPVQVVFGGPNSIQFQGQIASLDYTYTLFDVNMVPIECTADIGIMRLYNPTISSAPIINPLIKQYGQVGNFPTSNAKATFNAGVTGIPGLITSYTTQGSGS